MQSSTQRTQARMLVVDDEPRNRKLLEGYLLSESYEVVVAEDGPKALAMAAADPPDVVLLDIMMPGLTGHEVCRSLKADPRTRICQVMMVTALTGAQHTVEGLDTGADDYVSKPVRRQEFLAKVRALVRVSRLLRELEQAHAALTASNAELKLKKDLAQMLVHDLKSPLAAILGNLDLLAMVGDEQWMQLVGRSQQSATRMLRMILDLLDVEKLEQGRIQPRPERIDLGELGGAAIDEADVTARLREVMLEVDVPRGAWIEADAALLRRVLDNLIANAISHSPAGSRVRVSVRHRDEGVELSVVDAGPGVPEELRETIFEKYSQLNSRGGAGTSNKGLGLTFCRLAVEAHGGTIWVDASPEGGACFRVILPDAGQKEQGQTEAGTTEASSQAVMG